ncbi:MAG: sortase domain-containing protein [Acidimicrobiales bacterium]
MKLRLVAGASLLVLAVAAAAYPAWWDHHQAAAGSHLVMRERARIAATTTAATTTAAHRSAACSPKTGPGILAIRALGLTAPVQQGLSEATLAVAVGHDPATSWPAPGALTILSSHDVGYFAHTSSLTAGQRITYTEPCGALSYRVTGHLILKPGQAIPAIPGGGIVLDSCYPTNALWYTPDRYLVLASYVGETASKHAPTPGPSAPQDISAPVVLPAGLSAAELTLTTNSWLMGHLSFTGSPSPAFLQSPAPLQAEGKALEVLFGLRHALAAHDAAWLAALAPGVHVPVGLAATPAAPLEVTEAVAGSTVEAVTLTSSTTAGPVTLTVAPRSGKLVAVA